jgi:hypothetical protein
MAGSMDGVEHQRLHYYLCSLGLDVSRRIAGHADGRYIQA